MNRILKIGMDVHSTNYTLCVVEPGVSDTPFITSWKNVNIFTYRYLAENYVATRGSSGIGVEA